MPCSTCYAVTAAALFALPAAATPAPAPALAETVSGAAASVPELPAGWAEPAASPAPAPALKLTDETIRRAIRATLDAAGEPAGMLAAGAFSAGAPPAERYQRFAETFSSARIPGCLRPDGTKFQPPAIGQIGLSGLLALPFVVAAAVRGKCR